MVPRPLQGRNKRNIRKVNLYMDMQNYTKKTIEALQTAQNMAAENRNTQITPEHVLYALIDADGGLIGSLLSRMGCDVNAVLAELDTEIGKLPRAGSDTQVYLAPETERVLRAAEKTAKSMGDEYLSVEHLMLAMFSDGTPAIRRILADHGVTKRAF